MKVQVEEERICEETHKTGKKVSWKNSPKAEASLQCGGLRETGEDIPA